MAHHIPLATLDLADLMSSHLPSVPDHQLLRCIGNGSYGEVWLAQHGVLGTYRAVKFVQRKNFSEQRPFERELAGLQSFEPISRKNAGWVPILQVGRSADGASFYYIMELADDQINGRNIVPQTYVPKTLSSELAERGRLPVGEVVRLGLALVRALGELHRHGLIHRDIKPSNIIFIEGVPKLADIGLVTGVERKNSFVGTEFYTPEKGSSCPSADLYSVGQVLYRAATGKDAAEYPDLPTDLDQMADSQFLIDLNEIYTQACHRDPAKRFQTAEAMIEKLEHLLSAMENNLAREAVVAESGLPKTKPEIRGLVLPLEQTGGVVGLDSKFYVVRPADAEFKTAVSRRDSIVLVSGARQIGKTSLLVRGLEKGRSEGTRTVFTDLQQFNAEQFTSLQTVYEALSDSIADQLELDVLLSDVWEDRRAPNMNFDLYVRRHILRKDVGHVVWVLDEVDRLFTCSFSGDIFGLFRAWHNKRPAHPDGPWVRLTLVISYATEAHLFITDLNQSPFNVGTRLTLDDFTKEQVADLNQRHGSPLKTDAELSRFHRLLNGQPYLVRRGLYELVTQKLSFAVFEARADRDDGPFGDHLRRLFLSLSKEPALLEVVRSVLRGNKEVDADAFYRLRSAGVLAGESHKAARFRCQLYANYLRRHLI